jgi:inhibitor of KinA
MTPRFLSAGDRAVVVEFGDRVDRTLNAAVLRLAAAIRAAPPAGVVETVPSFRSLMVHYDPLLTSHAALEAAIRRLLGAGPETAPEARLWRIPVCYAEPFAPDLAEVAERLRLPPDEVVRLHSGTRYHVYMLGFLPGFPYLGDMPERLALPRRADPRLRVPRGAVSIATNLTAIYPWESPGGWHLIGTTPVPLFDPARPRPALLAPGDAVRFEPIDPARHAAIAAAVAAGRWETAGEPLPA